MPSATRLARLHDALLFLCAYPPNRRELKRAEALLGRFARRMRGVDPLLDLEVSGIAGTAVEAVFSCDLLRSLVRRFPGQLEIDWEEPPDSDRLAAALLPLLPFLAEEVVDADPSFVDMAKERGLVWLIENLQPPAYDSLGLWIRWNLGNSSATRTLMRRRPRTIFYQRTLPLSRREVSIARELAGPPLRISRLAQREGVRVLDMARAALATRYRELYCFTWGDPSAVFSADCGRGLEILLMGIIPEKRLPLRAGFGTFFLRNGVPVGYADAFGLCERMEVSFNIFYAFRDGESAFCFARLLKLYHQLFGSTSFSIDPYQLGAGNEEAIEAGAFWFYRKLGFRATSPQVELIARREERRIAGNRRHRTSARMLRRIARSPLIYDMHESRDWDHFHIRNITRRIGARPASLASVLELVPDLSRSEVWEIMRAKSARTEQRYLQLLAHHERLRSALIKLGSS